VHLVGFIIRALNLVSNHVHSGPQSSKISKIAMLLVCVNQFSQFDILCEAWHEKLGIRGRVQRPRFLIFYDSEDVKAKTRNCGL